MVLVILLAQGPEKYVHDTNPLALGTDVLQGSAEAHLDNLLSMPV